MNELSTRTLFTGGMLALIGGGVWLASALFSVPYASLMPVSPEPVTHLEEGVPAVVGATSTVPVSAENGTTLMAWIYPGKESCGVSEEYKDGRQINVLKPEYYTVGANGKLVLLTESARGCAGYSAQNAAEVRAHSNQQFVTVSGAVDSMNALTKTANSRKNAVTTLRNFVKNTGFTGVEIDFEDFGSWDAVAYANYKTFLKELGSALRADGKKLMVDIPPISSDEEQSYYLLTYKDMAELPIDYLVIMAYDYQFDHGAGTPIAPNAWVQAVITNAKEAISDTNRIVIGMPSYGYSATTGAYQVTRKSYTAMKGLKGFANAPRDSESFERMFTIGKMSHVYIDSAGLDAKRALIEAEGITNISVWTLGGNLWFSK